MVSLFMCLLKNVVFICHTGVLLISLALCADAAIGNVQEKAMKLHNGSNSEMVLCLSSLRVDNNVYKSIVLTTRRSHTNIRGE